MRVLKRTLFVAVSAGVWAGCSADLSSTTPSGDVSAPPEDASILSADASMAHNDAGGDARTDAASESPGAPSGVTAVAVPVGVAVTTLAGSGTATFADGTGTAASFQDPLGVAVDATGNVYVADQGNNRVRKLTPAGVVTTLAGSGTYAFADGMGTAASFRQPFGVAVDAADNVYVADHGNNRIRKITPVGLVTTLAGSGSSSFADGTGAAASFSSPEGVAVDVAGNVYVADVGNNRIRKVTPAGVVTTLAGSGMANFADGTGNAASFNIPSGVAVDAAGNVYVADTYNCRIRKVTSAGVVTTLAGSGFTNPFADGPGAAATFSSPEGVSVDVAGNVYVGDVVNQRIRKVTPAGVVTTLAGSGTAAFADGVGAAASFNYPIGIAIDAAGTLYVGDEQNCRIRKVTSGGTGQVSVSWSAPTTTGSSAITAYAATASAGGQTTQTCTTTGATSCTISGLTSGVAYSVSVTASNSVGTSAPSAAVSTTPN